LTDEAPNVLDSSIHMYAKQTGPNYLAIQLFSKPNGVSSSGTNLYNPGFDSISVSAFPVNVKLSVRDDKYKLYVDGSLISSGTHTAELTSSQLFGHIGIINDNTGRGTANFDNFSLYSCDDTDFSCYGTASLADLAILAANWLNTGDWLTGELSGNSIVNFIDFAIFANQW